MELTPEYTTAVQYLMELLKNPQPLQTYISEDILQHGNVQFLSSGLTLKNIPSADGWRWNQTRSRKRVTIHGANVTFFKLTPRRKSDALLDATLPSFKMWKFIIAPTSKDIPFQILWCEKGATAERSYGCIHPMTEDSFANIDEFSFLAPFMDSHLASLLWPNK